MILQTINKTFVRKKAQLVTFLALSMSILFLQQCHAHTVTISKYNLLFKNGVWVLNFKQKTATLRDAIYSLHPELRGENLNSSCFLSETEKYITTTLNLTINGKKLKIIPNLMRFGGLVFKADFLVNDLPKNPNKISISISGFDNHHHSVKLFTISEDSEQFRRKFYKDDTQASFNFNSKEFQTTKKNTKENNVFFFMIATLILFVIIGTWLKKKAG